MKSKFDKNKQIQESVKDLDKEKVKSASDA